MDTARLAVEYSTRLRGGEKALLATDTGIRDYPGWADVADAVYAAARYVGAEIARIEYLARDIDGAELPEVVGGAMAEADVVYIASTASLLQTKAVQAGRKAGARIMNLGAAASNANTIGAGRGLDLAPRSVAEIEEWGVLTTRLANLFRKRGTLHVTTKKGTDITCELGQLEVLTMDALPKEPGGVTHLIPGLAIGGPTPGSTQGVLVVDASIVPIKRPLTNEDPVALHIRDGYVVKVEGGSAAREWERRAAELNDPEAYCVAEAGFGCHPRSRTPVGWPTEDERLYGAFHLGIGSNLGFGGNVAAKWHIDATATTATAEFNGKVIVSDGEFGG